MLFGKDNFKIVFLIMLLFLLVVGCSHETKDTVKHKLKTRISGEGKIKKKPDKEFYKEGKKVELIAKPNQEDNWKFKQWKGSFLSGDQPKKTVKINDGKMVVEAKFIDLPEMNLEIKTDKDKPKQRIISGNITEKGGAIKRVKIDWDDKEEIEEGKSFQELSKSHDYSSGGIYNITVTATNKKGNTNEFSKEIKITSPDSKTTTINTKVVGEGRIKLNPDKEEYNVGEELTLTAKPAEEYKFIGWNGIKKDGKEIEVIVSKDMSLTAVFKKQTSSISGITNAKKVKVLEKEIETLVSNKRYNFMNLSPKTYHLKFIRKNYYSKTKEITVNPNQNTSVSNTTLKPKKGSISGSTNAEKVTIRETDKTTNVNSGNYSFSKVPTNKTYTLDFEKNNYYSKTKTVTLKPNENKKMNHVNLSSKTGKIVGTTNAKEVIILEKGKKTVVMDNKYKFNNIQYGTYNLKFKKDNYYSKTKRVNLDSDQENVSDIKLEIKPAIIEGQTNASKIRIYSYDTEYEKNIDVISNTYSIKIPNPKGNYKLDFKKLGYTDRSHYIEELNPGEKRNLPKKQLPHKTLAKGYINNIKSISGIDPESYICIGLVDGKGEKGDFLTDYTSFKDITRKYSDPKYKNRDNKDLMKFDFELSNYDNECISNSSPGDRLDLYVYFSVLKQNEKVYVYTKPISINAYEKNHLEISVTNMNLYRTYDY